MGTVDDDLREVLWSGRADTGGDIQAFLNERHHTFLAHALTPAGDRRAVKRKFVRERTLHRKTIDNRGSRPSVRTALRPRH